MTQAESGILVDMFYSSLNEIDFLSFINSLPNSSISFTEAKSATDVLHGQTLELRLRVLANKGLIICNGDLYKVTSKGKWRLICAHPSINLWIGVMTFAILILTVWLLYKAA